ncbi:hypothetical protein KUV80_12130 [Fictibacillus nanhaiensis]|uniref:hypothetical protein n=1 Tax=Fictibacillus nanhaiensis TaxID=742169 RepID=UPI001C96A90B|nr:hypothetical protein [Fictibacillus nanhaiensis]MBY6037412.1 hypothetical protein [Fictibacillus nanhaiensis]
MKLWLPLFIISFLFLGLGIGYYATRLYEKSIALGFITTLLGIIIPFFLFIGCMYVFGLYNNGNPLQFKW